MIFLFIILKLLLFHQTLFLRYPPRFPILVTFLILAPPEEGMNSIVVTCPFHLQYSNSFKLLHLSKNLDSINLSEKPGLCVVPSLEGQGWVLLTSLPSLSHLPSLATPSYNPSETPLRNTATGYSDPLK